MRMRSVIFAWIRRTMTVRLYMSDESTRTSPGRRYTLMTAKIAVSFVLLAFLFSRIDLRELWSSVRSASLVWLAAALLAQGIIFVTTTWRWHVLLEAQHVHVKGRRLLGSMLVANFFNNFLPSNIGGDVIRIRDTA